MGWMVSLRILYYSSITISQNNRWTQLVTVSSLLLKGDCFLLLCLYLPSFGESELNWMFLLSRFPIFSYDLLDNSLVLVVNSISRINVLSVSEVSDEIIEVRSMLLNWFMVGESRKGNWNSLLHEDGRPASPESYHRSYCRACSIDGLMNVTCCLICLTLMVLISFLKTQILTSVCHLSHSLQQQVVLHTAVILKDRVMHLKKTKNAIIPLFFYADCNTVNHWIQT